MIFRKAETPSQMQLGKETRMRLREMVAVVLLGIFILTHPYS